MPSHFPSDYRPASLRTHTYHETLIAYMEHLRNLGYSTVNITAIPPLKGDDYVFYCPPPFQKIPSQERLLDWYKDMLNKGVKYGVVHEWRNLLEQVRHSLASAVVCKSVLRR